MIHALCYFAEKRMLLAFKLAQGLRKSKSLFVQEAVVCTILKKILLLTVSNITLLVNLDTTPKCLAKLSALSCLSLKIRILMVIRHFEYLVNKH